MPPRSVTTSARAVILAGQSYVDVAMCLPECRSGADFLVQGIHVGPEVMVGATNTDVVKLPQWAVSVPVYQKHRSIGNPDVTVGVPFNALAQGAQHISATLPAGQCMGRGAGSASLPVRITLLGGVTASCRFEFNIHLTGICGIPFTCVQGRRATRPKKRK